MNCERISGALQRYADGEATPGERAAVEEELRVCSDCRARLDAIAALGSAVRDHLFSEAGDVSFDGVFERVLSQVKSEHTPSWLERAATFLRSLAPAPVLVPVAVSAAVLAVVGLGLYLRSVPPAADTVSGMSATAPAAPVAEVRITSFKVDSGTVIVEDDPGDTRKPVVVWHTVPGDEGSENSETI